MTFNVKSIKDRAKKFVILSNPHQTGVAALFLAISLLFSFFSFKLSGFSSDEVYNRIMTYYSNGQIDKAAEYLSSITPGAFQQFASALLLVTQIILETGFIIFTMNSVRNTLPAYGNLLDGFTMAGRIIFLNFLRYILTGLGLILFVVPGILLLYGYRLASFIMIDHPEFSVIRCMKESRIMMKGHKLDLFKLDFSFIFLILISSLPYIGSITQIYSLPYRYSSYVIFYEELCGRVIAEPEIDFPHE